MEPSLRPAASSFRAPRRAVGIGLVIVGVLALLWLAGLWFEGNLAWPVVLGRHRLRGPLGAR